MPNNNEIAKEEKSDHHIEPDFLEQYIADEVYGNGVVESNTLSNIDNSSTPADVLYTPPEEIIVRRYKLKKA